MNLDKTHIAKNQNRSRNSIQFSSVKKTINCLKYLFSIMFA